MKRKKYYAVSTKDLLDIVREGWEQIVRDVLQEVLDGERFDDGTDLKTRGRSLREFGGDQDDR